MNIGLACMWQTHNQPSLFQHKKEAHMDLVYLSRNMKKVQVGDEKAK